MIRRVVLLHGLWMPGVSMHWLATRLRTRGFEPESFGYHSIVGSPDAAMPRLVQRLSASDCHVVAHSLGGLVALETLATHPGLPVARVVCLGTPLAGSGAAAGLARWPMASLWMGRSAELLRRGCVAWPAQVQVGMVAGSVPRGLGAFVAGFSAAHDGTVAVAETQQPALTDHVVVAASHSGLLMSEDAAMQAATFLAHGRFELGGSGQAPAKQVQSGPDGPAADV